MVTFEKLGFRIVFEDDSTLEYQRDGLTMTETIYVSKVEKNIEYHELENGLDVETLENFAKALKNIFK